MCDYQKSIQMLKSNKNVNKYPEMKNLKKVKIFRDWKKVPKI